MFLYVCGVAACNCSPLRCIVSRTFLPPANEVCEGYVFTGVCLSTGGGACVVAGRGHAWLLVGGHAWLLAGGHAWLLAGGGMCVCWWGRA